MRKLFTRLLKDESANVLVEYSLLLGTLSIVALALMTSVGTEVAAKITTIGSSIPTPP